MKLRRGAGVLPAVIGVICMGAVTVAEGADAPGWSLYDRYTQSYAIPFDPTPDFADPPETAIHVNVSVDGGETANIQVDTGSQGMAISSINIPNFRPGGEPGSISYVSDGVTECGYWQPHTVSFPDSYDERGRLNVVKARVRILAVTTRCVNNSPCQPGNQTKDCKPDTTTAMLGIGFGRKDSSNPEDGSSPYQPSLGDNPLLNLPLMKRGVMRAGYVLSRKDIKVGLTSENAGSGFAMAKLQRMLGQSTPNWTAMSGSFSVDGVSEGPSSALIDSGIPYMWAAGPTLSAGLAPAGTQIAVQFFDVPGIAGFSFAAGRTAAGTPAYALWDDYADSTWFNTGIQPLRNFTLAFDADGGYAGLKLVGKGEHANASPSLILSGPVRLHSAFSATYPVVLSAAAEVKTRGSALLSGPISGPGALSLFGGTVTFAGRGALPGGVVVEKGTFVLTGRLRTNVTVMPGARFINKGRLIGRVIRG